MWTQQQRTRLAIEEKLLQKYMPDFKFYDRTQNTYIAGIVNGPQVTQDYTVMIPLPLDFPFSKPKMYIIRPEILRLFGGQATVNSLSTSHDFHTLENGPNGVVQICYLSHWDASITCVKAILMARLWLVAYEQHLLTGEPVARYLGNPES